MRLPSQSTKIELTLELPATALISLKMGEEEVMVRLAEVVIMAVKEVWLAFNVWIGAKAEALPLDGRELIVEIARAFPGWLFHWWQG